jgi:predicted small metal-binding protein
LHRKRLHTAPAASDTTCDFQATGDTNDEILAKAAEHAKTAHGFDGIPPELLDKVQAAIKDA